MRDEQWTALAHPEGRHREREALDFLQEELPGYPPFRAWANFRFLPLEGGFFDVDLLVCSPVGLFLVELHASAGAKLHIGAQIWERLRQNGEVDVFDNPLELANQKAGQLREALGHFIPGKTHAPPVEPLVFVSQPDVDVDIDPDATDRIVFHPDAEQNPSVLDALINAEGPGVRGTTDEITKRVRDRVGQALQETGIDASTKHLRVGDWELDELIDTAPRYQDFVADHRSRDEKRRARVFRSPKNAGDEQLERLQEAARREFDILQELEHPSILPAKKHIGHETRPSILFEHPPGAERLDHFMRRGTPPSARERFTLLSDIAEAVRYAHGHRVVHRALSPQSVLVSTREEQSVQIFNWHTSPQADNETGTRHVSDYLADPSKFFLAPELRHSPDVDETADIFSLGALAFFLFTGEPPARTLSEFSDRIADEGGLRLSNFLETVEPTLDDLVYDATRVSVDDRIATAEKFIERLEQAKDRTLDEREVRDPLEAQSGDLLDGRWTVRQRLGSGATSTALLAGTADSGDVVLKIANDEAHASRLKAEAEALRKFDDELVVDLYDEMDLGGRRTLVLQHAGNTLRKELRDRSALSLDEQRRWGEDLCQILRSLEEHSVFHRDIKPANLGINRPTGRGRFRLMLFDFSLNGVPVDATHVGTKAYRDPMLESRGQWDAHADRYAGAVVLYEMVTQQLPDWGRTSPALDESAEVQLEAERFPAAIRDALTRFFEKAFARNWRDRFDTASEMLEEWRDVMGRTVHSDHDEGIELSDDITPATALHGLGISDAARDALDKLEATTVGELLCDVFSNDIKFLKGAGGEVRSELRDLRQALAARFPTLDVQSDHAEEDHVEPGQYGDYSVDRVLELVHDKPKNIEIPGQVDREDFGEFIGQVFSEDTSDGALPWPDVVQLATRAGLDADDFDTFFHSLREAWRNKKVLAALRDDIVRIIDSNGGAMTDRELARAVLADRGCIFSKNDRRIAAASAIARAAVETERATTNPRLHLLRQTGATPSRRSPGPTPSRRGDKGSTGGSTDRQLDRSTAVFVATKPELLDVIPNLGEIADLLATEQPLASSDRAYRSLNDALDDADLQPLPRHRALALAAAAGTNAAVSQRDELYPVGMDPVRALKLTSNLLLRRAPLSAEQIRDAVRSRYPRTAEISTGPELQELLEEADVELALDPERREGKGEYVVSGTVDDSKPNLTRGTASGSVTTSERELTTAQRKSRVEECQEQLERKSADRGFFALTVAPKRATQAAAKLADDYDLEPVSLDRVFLETLRDATDQLGIDWNFFLEIDNPDNATANDRNRLANLLRNGFGDVPPIVDQVTDRLHEMGDRLLLTDPGLLGRWQELGGTMHILESLRDRTRSDGPELVWLLIPADKQKDRPTINSIAVPVDKGDWLRIPQDAI